MEPSSSRNGKVATELDVELRREVAEIENILGYTFRNKSLLVEAITHASYAGHPSYQRLEFVGDAVLGLAVSNYLYEKYPDIGPGHLTALRRANVSNERLARVAVRLGLYRFLRRNCSDLDRLVSEFKEDDTDLKVLADMVESIAAAVYKDFDFDMKLVWEIFSKILDPFITLDTMEEPPVATLDILCQKRGKTLEFRSRSSMFGSSYTVDAFVDGMVMGTGSARKKRIAERNAAREALPKLSGMEAVSFEDDVVDDGHNLDNYKQRLYDYCDKKRWINPLYKIVKEEGPAHSKKFMSSVTVGSDLEDLKTCYGDLEPKMKYAENSAARHMLSILQRPDEEGEQSTRISNGVMISSIKIVV